MAVQPCTRALRPLIPHPLAHLATTPQRLYPNPPTYTTYDNGHQTGNHGHQTASLESVYGKSGPWYPPFHDGCPIGALHRHAAGGRIDFPSTEAVMDMLERARLSVGQSAGMQEHGLGGFE